MNEKHIRFVVTAETQDADQKLKNLDENLSNVSKDMKDVAVYVSELPWKKGEIAPAAAAAH